MKAKAKRNITDRAKRYRANRAMEAAGRTKERCSYCGNPEAGDVEHLDGDESNNRDENLVMACRPCNVEKGKTFADAGIGIRTHQYNPASGVGAQNLGQYMAAVMTLKGQSDQMTIPSAVRMIRHTSKAKRREFAHQIWDRRRKRQGEVPF